MKFRKIKKFICIIYVKSAKSDYIIIMKLHKLMHILFSNFNKIKRLHIIIYKTKLLFCMKQ